MISATEVFSQGFINVQKQCNFSCFGCDLWKSTDGTTFDAIFETIALGRFFDVYPKKKVFNIYGGEPFEQKQLPVLLQFLKQEGIQTRIWTNGYIQEQALLDLRPYIDQLAIVLPHCRYDYYQNITGMDVSVFNKLSFLKSEGFRFFLHHRVNKETIAFLPEFYDFIYQNNYFFLFHYLFKGAFGLSKDEHAHIQYYSKMNTIHVYPVSRYEGTACHYVPVGLFDHRYGYLLNYYRKKCRMLLNRWGIS